jgi:hypothetical protein
MHFSSLCVRSLGKKEIINEVEMKYLIDLAATLLDMSRCHYFKNRKVTHFGVFSNVFFVKLHHSLLSCSFTVDTNLMLSDLIKSGRRGYYVE